MLRCRLLQAMYSICFADWLTSLTRRGYPEISKRKATTGDKLAGLNRWEEGCLHAMPSYFRWRDSGKWLETAAQWLVDCLYHFCANCTKWLPCRHSNVNMHWSAVSWWRYAVPSIRQPQSHVPSVYVNSFEQWYPLLFPFVRCQCQVLLICLQTSNHSVIGGKIAHKSGDVQCLRSIFRVESCLTLILSF